MGIPEVIVAAAAECPPTAEPIVGWQLPSATRGPLFGSIMDAKAAERPPLAALDERRRDDDHPLPETPTTGGDRGAPPQWAASPCSSAALHLSIAPPPNSTPETAETRAAALSTTSISVGSVNTVAEALSPEAAVRRAGQPNRTLGSSSPEDGHRRVRAIESGEAAPPAQAAEAATGRTGQTAETLGARPGPAEAVPNPLRPAAGTERRSERPPGPAPASALPAPSTESAPFTQPEETPAGFMVTPGTAPATPPASDQRYSPGRALGGPPSTPPEHDYPPAEVHFQQPPRETTQSDRRRDMAPPVGLTGPEGPGMVAPTGDRSTPSATDSATGRPAVGGTPLQQMPPQAEVRETGTMGGASPPPHAPRGMEGGSATHEAHGVGSLSVDRGDAPIGKMPPSPSAEAAAFRIAPSTGVAEPAPVGPQAAGTDGVPATPPGRASEPAFSEAHGSVSQQQTAPQTRATEQAGMMPPVHAPEASQGERGTGRIASSGAPVREPAQAPRIHHGSGGAETAPPQSVGTAPASRSSHVVDATPLGAGPLPRVAETIPTLAGLRWSETAAARLRGQSPLEELIASSPFGGLRSLNTVASAPRGGTPQLSLPPSGQSQAVQVEAEPAGPHIPSGPLADRPSVTAFLAPQPPPDRHVWVARGIGPSQPPTERASVEASLLGGSQFDPTGTGRLPADGGRAVAGSGEAEGYDASLMRPGDLAHQLMPHLGRLSFPSNSHLRLHLKPPSLGTLDLHLTLKAGVLALEIRAESPRARDLIESALPQLRHALDQRGIEVGQVSLPGTGDMDRQAQWGGGYGGYSGLRRDSTGEQGRAWSQPPPPAPSEDEEPMAPHRRPDAGQENHHRVDYRI